MTRLQKTFECLQQLQFSELYYKLANTTTRSKTLEHDNMNNSKHFIMKHITCIKISHFSF